MSLPGTIWKHYKGGFYRFVTECTCESTGQKMVVYESVETGKKYVRPLDEFVQKFTPATQHEAWIWNLKKQRKIT